MSNIRTSLKEDQDFQKLVVTVDVNAAAQWFNDNAEPDDVFDNDKLVDWAKVNCEPSELFDARTLRDWAEANGYAKDE